MDDTYYYQYNNLSTTSRDAPMEQEQVPEGSQSSGSVRRSTRVDHPKVTENLRREECTVV